MSKVRFIKPILSASGRLFGGSNIYFRTNRLTGKSHTGTIRNPYKGPSSTAQQATRERFRYVMSLVKTQLQDPAKKAQWQQEFMSQNEIGTLVGFVYHMLNKQLL